MRYVIEERFVVSISEPGEESGKTTRHVVEAASLEDALREHAMRSHARLLGRTERPDGSIAATLWRGERLFRIHAIAAETEN